MTTLERQRANDRAWLAWWQRGAPRAPELERIPTATACEAHPMAAPAPAPPAPSSRSWVEDVEDYLTIARRARVVTP